MTRRAIRLWFALLLCCALAPPAPAANLAEGDMDGDGRITVEDLKAIGRHINTHEAAYKGDVNADGVVDAKDVRELATLLVKTAVPGRPVTDADVERFMREAMRDGPAPDSGGDPFAGGSDGRSGGGVTAGGRPGSGAASGRGPAVDPAEVSVQVDGGADAGAGDTLVPGGAGSGRGVDLSGGETGSGAGGGRGKKAAYPKDQKEHLGRASGEAGAPKAGDAPTIDDLNARRSSSFGGPLGTQKLDAALKSAEGKSVKSIGGSEPGPAFFMPPASDRGVTPRPVASVFKSDEKKDLNPRSNYGIDATPEKVSTPEVTSRTSGAKFGLGDEYEKFSGPEDLRLPTAVTDLLDADVTKASDDPIASQTMKDFAREETFRQKADKDGDKSISRNEFYGTLFGPETIRAILLGGGANPIGLKPDSTIVRNYEKILRDSLPWLESSGIVDRTVIDRAKTAIAEVDRIRTAMTSRPGGGGGGSDNPFGGFLDFLNGLSGGDFTGGGFPTGGEDFGGGAIGGGGAVGGGAGATIADIGAGAAGTAGDAAKDAAGGASGTASADSGGTSFWGKVWNVTKDTAYGAATGAATGMTAGPIGAVTGMVSGGYKAGTESYTRNFGN